MIAGGRLARAAGRIDDDRGVRLVNWHDADPARKGGKAPASSDKVDLQTLMTDRDRLPDQ